MGSSKYDELNKRVKQLEAKLESMSTQPNLYAAGMALYNTADRALKWNELSPCEKDEFINLARIAYDAAVEK